MSLKDDTASDTSVDKVEGARLVSDESNTSNNTTRKRLLPEDEDKLEARRAANRRSALESRLRRKRLIEDLQKAVKELTAEKTVLAKESIGTRMQLEAALAENRQLRFINQQQQLALAASTTPTTAGAQQAMLAGAMNLQAAGFAQNPALASLLQQQQPALGPGNGAFLTGVQQQALGGGAAAGPSLARGRSGTTTEAPSQQALQEQLEGKSAEEKAAIVSRILGINTAQNPPRETQG